MSNTAGWKKGYICLLPANKLILIHQQLKTLTITKTIILQLQRTADKTIKVVWYLFVKHNLRSIVSIHFCEYANRTQLLKIIAIIKHVNRPTAKLLIFQYTVNIANISNTVKKLLKSKIKLSNVSIGLRLKVWFSRTL